MTVLITDHPSVMGYLLPKSTSIFKPFMTFKYNMKPTTILKKDFEKCLWNKHESLLREIVSNMKKNIGEKNAVKFLS